jgi:sugar phosphate isomerase/epimerase
MDYIFQEFSSPKLVFCYDSGHNNCYTPQRDFLRQYGSKLFALHLHDNDGIEDLHMIPFDGNIAWDKVKEQVEGAGYSGPIVLEVEQGRHRKYKNMSAEEFLSRAFSSTAKLQNKHIIA